jgi:hypothetical protein
MLDLLSDLPALAHLHLQATRMHGHVRIPPMGGLQTLKLTKAQMITHVELPAEFAALETLEIQHAALLSPPALHHCRRLQALSIKHSPLQNLNGLVDLHHLKILNLEWSAIPREDLAALRQARSDLKIEF